MPIRTLHVSLLSDGDEIGSLTFSYDDAAPSSQTVEGTQRTVFFLTDLLLQVRAGTVRPFIENEVILTQSSDIFATRLAYDPSVLDRLGVLQVSGGEFSSFWILQADEDNGFLIRPTEWAVGPMATLALGQAEFQPLRLPPERISVAGPLGPRRSLFPNLAAPVSRPTLVDPNSATGVNHYLNDPMRLLTPAQCGCHLLSGTSMVMCRTACNLLSSRRSTGIANLL